MYRNRNRGRWIIATGIGVSVILLTVAAIGYDTGKSLYSKIKVLYSIAERIHVDYVEEVEVQDLIDNAIKGMVDKLDPHTSYLTAEFFERWSQNYEGYSGIGISFDIIKDKITVMSVFNGGPSDKIGILPGDRIIEIDGIPAIGMKRDEVPLKLMGMKGTKVSVGIERTGFDMKKFVIIRDEVHLESVPYSFILRPGVGYIGTERFSSTTADELERHLLKLEAQGLNFLILDLRTNGGGYLDAAVDVVDKFLPKNKRIVYTKGRIRESFREFFSSEKNTHPLIPMLVLIDRISASASEIVAGALQDWDRALILGETSFGKGLVQSQYRFEDGSALLMTTAKYYTPSGRLIQRPYSDKSLETYYSEITNDSLRKKLEQDPSRKSFKTMILRRDVLGEGGITPDIFLKAPRDTLSEITRKILYAPDRLFFTFTEDLLTRQPDLKLMDFNEFLRNYRPENDICQKFLSYVRSQGIKITAEEYTQNLKDIQFLLKQTIALKIWGDDAQYKVQLLRDKQLIEALSYLDEAKGLLARAYVIPQ